MQLSAPSALHTFPSKSVGPGQPTVVQERRKLMQKSCIPHFFQVAWNSQKCHSFLNQLMQPNWAHALQSFSWLSIKWANSSLLSWIHFSQAVKMSRYCDLTSWVLFVMLCISRSTFRSLIRPVHFVTRPTWVGTAPLKCICVWLEIVGPVRSSSRYDVSLYVRASGATPSYGSTTLRNNSLRTHHFTEAHSTEGRKSRNLT